jgi:Linear amide C-N hydrolases, choloylglycine hydrolase family
MCTSFVYRKSAVLIGMNFDNNGKDFKVSVRPAGKFLVSISVQNTFFPSIGVNREGMFVNDMMVDASEAGKYKRQNEKRWVTTSLVKYVMEEAGGMEDVRNLLQRVEIVNAPNASTHPMIVDRHGSVCIVEPGRKNLISGRQESDWIILTNFPLSAYAEAAPAQVSGSGADRYLTAQQELASLPGPITVAAAFKVLEAVKQDGPEWTTELSLVYDAARRALFYCLDRKFDEIVKCDFQKPSEIIHAHG